MRHVIQTVGSHFSSLKTHQSFLQLDASVVYLPNKSATPGRESDDQILTNGEYPRNFVGLLFLRRL